AAIPMLSAIGPEMLAEVIRPETLRQLGLDPNTMTGPFFRTLDAFAEKPDQAKEQLDKAMDGPWAAKDCPEIAKWLNANSRPLGRVGEASRRPRYFIPLVPTGELFQMISMLMPNYSSVREAGRALAARAMMRLKEGDLVGACADLLTVHRLARLISQDNTLLARLVGIGLEATACKADKALAATEPGAKQAKQYLADLSALGPLPQATDATDVPERFGHLDYVMSLARAARRGRKAFLQPLQFLLDPNLEPGLEPGGDPGEPVPNVLDWDLLLRSFNERFDKLVAVGKQPTHAARQRAAAVFREQAEALRRKVGRRHGGLKGLSKLLRRAATVQPANRREISKELAEALRAILEPDVTRIHELRDRAVQHFDLAKLALALAVHKAEKGTYPDKLSALAPAYVKAVPKDLFTDRPLVYKRQGKGYILYSLGPNMKDDGGKTRDQDPEDFDIVVKVPK
ncbi:MAG TPA: hypothetical protein VM098_08385, partial [Phycisphaerae bacterium]|nr:hypothetical protein [Phycisphaerae bacterium]